MFESRLQQALVVASESFETAFKPALKLPDIAFRLSSAMLVPAHDEHHHGRNQGSRQEIRGQHGERDRLRQRNEKKLCDTREKEHRYKHNADTKRRYQCWHSNLLRAIENGLLHLLAHGKVALDIFNLDRRIIHQNADSEREPSQGHDVDRLAQSSK